METFLTAPAGLCLGATAALVFAELTRQPGWNSLLKPVAAAGFLWAALDWGALQSAYGQWILGGLVLCALGDLLLIARGRGRAFLAGIVVFLAGHVVYLAAFASFPLSLSGAGIALPVMAAFAGLILYWLLPWTGSRFRMPVIAYVLVLSAMVVVAAAAVGGGAHPVLLAGAAAFALSDIAVARNRFVAPGPINRVWGLPLYFLSQLMIAWTVSTVAG